MGWLDEHIQEFVKPQIGEFNQEPLGLFTSEEMTIIKNSWRSTKKSAGNKKIVLAGRDVFIYEILARRENYPTIFMPDCSRMSVAAIKERFPNVEDYFLFDTGFVGSIPRNLGIENFILLSFSSGMDRQKSVERQTFPRLTFSRSLALKIEGTPKYWESARVDENGEIIQPISNRSEFEKAARLTIEIYKNSSPKFVQKHQPISTGRRWF